MSSPKQILFNGPMVRAILEGRKTQTRRIIAPVQPRHDGMWPAGRDPVSDCPYPVGSRLWVRERARVLWWSGPSNGDSRVRIRYEADGAEADVTWPARLLAPIVGQCIPNGVHREGGRTFLEVVSVRAERMHDMTDNDAKAEGLACLSKDGGRVYKYGIPDRDGLPGTDDDGWSWADWSQDPVMSFRRLWDSVYGAGSFDADPWVWRVEFRRVEP